MLHKIGTVVVAGTDNLLISKFVGLASVGLYSNYVLVTNSANQILSLLFQSLTSSIGNFISKRRRKQKNSFIVVLICSVLDYFFLYY